MALRGPSAPERTPALDGCCPAAAEDIVMTELSTAPERRPRASSESMACSYAIRPSPDESRWGSGRFPWRSRRHIEHAADRAQPRRPFQCRRGGCNRRRASRSQCRASAPASSSHRRSSAITDRTSLAHAALLEGRAPSPASLRGACRPPALPAGAGSCPSASSSHSDSVRATATRVSSRTADQLTLPCSRASSSRGNLSSASATRSFSCVERGL